MIRLRDVSSLVRDQDEALAFLVDGLGFVVRQDETFDGAWDLIHPVDRLSGCRHGGG